MIGVKTSVRSPKVRPGPYGSEYLGKVEPGKSRWVHRNGEMGGVTLLSREHVHLSDHRSCLRPISIRLGLKADDKATV